MAMLVSIWNMRNAILFRGEKLSPFTFYRGWSSKVDVVISALNRKKQDNQKTGVDEETGNGEMMESKEIKEGRPVYLVHSGDGCHLKRIMVDASWDSQRVASFGWCLLNEEEAVVYEGKAKGRAENPLQAETKGLKMALDWARMEGLLHLEISSDCLQLVTQLADIGMVHHSIEGLLEEVAEISSYFHCLCISYIPRAFNCRAHKLAEEARNL
ncbi:uncharacterized protein LOC141628391 [Silene latifolia]|uniref:uncharacterized protein LOC141628391 n=1 Tax=Silene latifolia TaxID=37657 RepID=UPI003D77BBB6